MTSTSRTSTPIKATLAALAAALLLLPTEAVAWQDADAAEPAPQDQQPEQTIDLRARDFIFVEGSLPFVPTSNSIASKLPLTLRQIPNNVGIVTRALFEQQYDRVLSGALRNVSNVNVQTGFGVTDYFVIRGFDSLSSTLIMTDGAPEPEATFYQLYNVEQVEVLKGPGGFLYGSNPLAGTVNLVRKQPFMSDGLSLGAAFGSFSTLEGVIDYNYGKPDGAVAFRFNGLVRDTESYRDGKDSTAIGINPALSWQISERHSLNTNFEYLRSDFSPEAGVPLLFNELPPVDPGTNYNSPTDRSEQDVYRFQIDYQGELSDTVTLRNKLYYRRLNWLSDGTLLVGAFPNFDGSFQPTGTFSVIRSQIGLDDDQTFLGNQFESIFRFNTGSVRHSLLTGLELARYADEFTLGVGLLPPVDLIDPIDPGNPAFPIPGQGFAGDARSNVVAPYAIDQISFSDRFQVLAGARLDAIDFKDEISGAERNDSKVSPMVGAVFLPTSDVSLYANFSRSFAPPSPRATSGFEPEESEQIEIGTRLELLDRNLMLTAAVYQLERQNIAIPDDNGFTQQTGNQRSRGFEVDLVAELGSGFRTAFSYAYNDSELTEFRELVQLPLPGAPVFVVIDHSGNSPAFAPKNLLNFWGSKTFRSGLGVGLGARYIGEQFIAENNDFTVPDAFVLSAALSYAWRGYRFSVNVDNFTDTEYLLRGFGSQSVTPAAPIAAYLRVGYDF